MQSKYIMRLTGIAIIFVFLSFQSFGQNLKRFKHLDINNGLSHSDATCFAQDEKGFMWIGTYNGIHRYDGYEVKQFLNESNQFASVYENRINVITKQGDYLWVGSQQGIYLFSTKYLKYCNLSVIGSDNSKQHIGEVISMFLTPSALWFVADNKLYKGNFNQSDTSLSVVCVDELVEEIPKEYFNAKINSIAGCLDDVLWVCSDLGLFELKIENNQYVFHKIQNFIPALKTKNEVIAYGATYKRNMLFVSGHNTLKIYMLDTNSSILSLIKSLHITSLMQNEYHINNIHIYSLQADENLNLWCSTPKGLLLVSNPLVNKPNVELMNHSRYDSHSISGNHISLLFIDKNNCLWAGTWGGGANILNLDQLKFNVLNHNPDRKKYNLSKDFVRCISEDEKGNIWIGFKSGGINIFNPETGEVNLFKAKNRTKNEDLFDDIRCIDICEKFVAVGCTDGFAIIDRKTNEIYEYTSDINDPNSISPGSVFSIKIDDKNTIWAGMWTNGLNRISVNEKYQIKAEKFNMETSPAMTSNSIVFLAFNSSYNQLYASSDKGLNRIYLDENRNVKNIVHYKTNQSPSSFKSNYIWPLIFENDSTLWLGTLGGGLCHVSLNEAKSGNTGSYSAKTFMLEGINTADVEILEKGTNGDIWVGSRGLAKLDPQTNLFQYYDEDNGLHGNGFKIGASYTASDGTIYMGGINGLTYFRPQDIKHQSTRSEIALLKLLVKNKEVMPGNILNDRIILQKELTYSEKIELNYLENDFSIKFGNVNFINPGKGIFEYRLSPYQTEWLKKTVASSKEIASANYANLPYGRYLFQVKGTSSNGLWTNEIVDLEIVVKAPWYLTRLAFVGYFILGVLIFWLVFSYTRRHMLMKQDLRIITAEEQKKDELHQHKLQFFTNISHEFKTPLTLIHSPLEKLYDEENPEGMRKELYQLVFNNTNRLHRLINELMDFRKAELNKHSLKLQATDLNLLVEETYNQFSSMVENKEIKLSYDAKSLPEVFVDMSKAQKILTNLFSNALKFTAEGGTIIVKTYKGDIQSIKQNFRNKHSELPDYESSEYAFIELEDSGVGISSKSINSVFERFYHEDLDQNNHLGSGIGLALVKSFVLLHKGCVFVFSERNKGSQFIVGFPCGNAHISKTNAIVVDNENEATIKNDRELDTIDEERGVQNKETLLFVEDNSELRTMLAQHFQSSFRVLQAENGKIGLEMAEEHMPDLIVSDVMMPVMDGIEMCRLIRDNVNTCHIPILLLTAKSSVNNQIIGTESGADVFIAKPFSLRLLNVKVIRILEHHSTLKERYTKDVFSNSREILRNKKDKKFFDTLMRVIEENIENPEFTVEDLIPELGVSRTRLYQKIKGLTGSSPLEFIRSQRLKLAAKILITEGVAISEVVYRVGIQSTSYFSKAFKIEFGMTPTEFLKQHEPIESNVK